MTKIGKIFWYKSQADNSIVFKQIGYLACAFDILSNRGVAILDHPIKWNSYLVVGFTRMELIVETKNYDTEKINFDQANKPLIQRVYNQVNQMIENERS